MPLCGLGTHFKIIILVGELTIDHRQISRHVEIECQNHNM